MTQIHPNPFSSFLSAWRLDPLHDFVSVFGEFPSQVELVKAHVWIMSRHDLFSAVGKHHRTLQRSSFVIPIIVPHSGHFQIHRCIRHVCKLESSHGFDDFPATLLSLCNLLLHAASIIQNKAELRGDDTRTLFSCKLLKVHEQHPKPTSGHQSKPSRPRCTLGIVKVFGFFCKL